jgi:hypothetical protein
MKHLDDLSKASLGRNQNGWYLQMLRPMISPIHDWLREDPDERCVVAELWNWDVPLNRSWNSKPFQDWTNESP